MAAETLPLISIIVPVYKSEEYLEQGIRSILEQTYSKLEIILVDDGSPNQAGALADEIARQDMRIKVIHKQNGGTASALNTGLNAITGEYVTISGDDDFMHKEMVNHLYNMCSNYDADMAIVDVLEVYDRDAPEEQISDVFEVLDKKEAIAALIEDKKIRSFFQGKLIKTELLEHLRFPEGMSYEDMAIFQDVLLSARRIVYNPSPLFYYYQNSNSILHTRDLRLNLDQLNAFEKQKNAIISRYPEFADALELRQLRFEISTGCYYLAKYRNTEKYNSAIKQMKREMMARYKNLNGKHAPLSLGDRLRLFRCAIWI